MASAEVAAPRAPASAPARTAASAPIFSAPPTGPVIGSASASTKIGWALKSAFAFSQFVIRSQSFFSMLGNIPAIGYTRDVYSNPSSPARLASPGAAYFPPEML
ncbi:hypothetical protein Atai01_56860 [Amycolatopsis taiwanensis]|uniref:Uncharacterized protein n=1 Tax=Amycolatopsis taiwanensis TaxID=342230 RepID=A0A9W6VJ36_9PSEU|nr:hypothetical protein Atai01_56860 [Amycolatopsis taiwanensis]